MNFKNKKISKITCAGLAIILAISSTGILSVFAKFSSDNKSELIKDVKTQQMVTVEPYGDYSYQQSIGLTKGNTHGRTALGMILPDGSQLMVRQVNTEYKSDLTLNLLSDDSRKEKSFTIPKNGNWVTAENIEHLTVPFIRKPSSQIKPVVEYKIVGEFKELPIYKNGDNQDDFLTKWDTTDAEFAFIENDRVQFFVPKIDKEHIRNNFYGSIQGLFDFYNKMLDLYDEMIGISYDAINVRDKNIRTQYFVKANANGAGLAYYANDHTAQNSTTMERYISNIDHWVILHEIGHGYEYGLSDEYGLGEVWNNILAFTYQQTFLKPGENAALYGKDRSKRDNDSYNLRKKGINNFKDLNYWERLYVFIQLLEYIGNDKFTEMNKLYRSFIESPEASKISSPENRIVLLFSLASGYNLYDYFYQYGIKASEQLKESLNSKNLKNIGFLYDMVDDATAELIKNKYNLKSKHSLISTDDIIASGLVDSNSKIKITLTDEEFAKLQGKKILLTLNNKTIQKKIINSKNMEFSSLSAGNYTIKVANHKFDYFVKTNVVTVGNNSEIDYDIEIVTEKQGSKLLTSQQVKFLGLGDWNFATLNVNTRDGYAELVTNRGKPHSYFNDAYVTVTITDSESNVKLQKSYIGNENYSYSVERVSIHPNDKLIITHREPERTQFYSEYFGVEDEYINFATRNLTFTNMGLQDSGINLEERAKKTIDYYADYLTKYVINQDFINYDKHSYFRFFLAEAINKLKPDESLEYKIKYGDIINFKSEKPLYNIALNSGTNGTVMIDKTNVREGDTVNVTVSPDSQYQLDSIKINGTLITGNSFTMPAGDVIIDVRFKLMEYYVDVVPLTNGTVEFDKTVANVGDVVNIKTTASAGYEVDKIMINGTLITGNSFTMPAENVTVEVAFKAIDYIVTVDSNIPNGILDIDKTLVNIGEIVTVTAIPNDGYQLKAGSLKVTTLGGLEIPLTQITRMANGRYTFEMPAENVVITAEFELIPVVTPPVEPPVVEPEKPTTEETKPEVKPETGKNPTTGTNGIVGLLGAMGLAGLATFITKKRKK